MLQGVASWSVAILFGVPAFLVPGVVRLFGYAFRRPDVWGSRASRTGG